MPGQRRIHFQKESPPRQRKILAAITELDVRVNLYAVPRADVASRRLCLTAIVRDAASTAERLDPLLRVPDAVVWARAKGREWRKVVREYCALRPV
ncbi:hypothetical protein E0H75_09640 [Kribbella capetownensis]|uniref:Uncharacterized protein n=1 Tax=Kribbella capetownensis TaxID=1572659 RepID=A0A4R0K1R5_9ACTN|nr:hypothetical protein [Kribbella capetownensis]TCC53903.1 hypothetical protein E0H75_09640 [Kribbella capetownensis]